MGLHDDSEETRRIGVWDTRPRGVVSMTISPAKCKLAINAMFMAYSVICPSEKSIDDLNDHLAGCLAQDPTLAALEALDILRAALERGEWFEEAGSQSDEANSTPSLAAIPNPRTIGE